jgi:hypothetical protein
MILKVLIRCPGFVAKLQKLLNCKLLILCNFFRHLSDVLGSEEGENISRFYGESLNLLATNVCKILSGYDFQASRLGNEKNFIHVAA